MRPLGGISSGTRCDPDDDHVLTCAVAGQADLIVSGDRHLHSLGGEYHGIRIVRPAEAVRFIEAG
ncbi:MAG: PIN domain-containing protein, partial [Gammaproteobacteria bacterium]